MNINKMQIKRNILDNKYSVSYDTNYVINQKIKKLITKKELINLIEKYL
jgi:hypothetical protein